MNGIILLLWISIIVILNVRAEDENTKSHLCEHCNSNTLPECLEVDDMVYNFTIHCQRSDQTPCVIALVAEKMRENEETEYLCLIRESEGVVNNFLDSKMSANIIEEQQTTMILETITENVLNENQKSTTFENDIKVNEEKMSTLSQFETATQNNIAETMNVVTEVAMGTENTINLVTAKPLESIDQPTTEAAQSGSVMETTQRVEFSDLPQADQPMPEINTPTLDEKPLLEIGNGIETSDVGNSIPMQPETVEAVQEIEPKMNSLENLATEAPTANVVKCFGCMSTEDANCITKPTKEVACKAVGETPIGCFTLIRDAKIMRGCLEDLDAQQIAQCLDSEHKSCYVCYGDSCNNESWPQCYVCSSNYKNSLCAWWSPQTSLEQLIRLCPAFDDMCRLEITENGLTTRGCVPQSNECKITQTVENCRVCNTTLCNGGVFPIGRLRCHQCADTMNCALEQATNTSLPCPIFINDDSCFLYANALGKMQRGCRSSVENFLHCMEYDEKRCLTCNTSDGCNSQPLMLEPHLSCSQCDTRVKNKPSSIGCAWAQSNETVFRCRNKYLYYLEETCEMIYQPDIELAVRGCSHDIGACESSYESCSDCKSEACNVENLASQYCLQCSSQHVENCSGMAAGIVTEKCKSTKQSFEMRGCYTSMSLDTNITTRGCISDLTAEEQIYCNTNKKLCTFCYEQGCNNRFALSGGNQMSMDNVYRLLLLGLIYSCL